MTNLELIEETIQYYSEDVNRRGIDNNKKMCVYKNPEDKKCAIGRMLDEELLEKDKISWQDLNETGDIDIIVEDGDVDIFKYFKSEYSNITSLKLLKDLQKFHDGLWYWDEEGLSTQGKEFAEQLKITYA